jgi:hypothetical protein
MPHKHKFTIKEMRAAIQSNGGLIMLAAEGLGCSRNTVYRYMERYPRLAEVCEEQREKLVDLAERGLRKHVEHNNREHSLFITRRLP